ncbi:MAG: hypothetical protein ABIK78_01215 [candidate division WOR-3 bacterium]
MALKEIGYQKIDELLNILEPELLAEKIKKAKERGENIEYFLFLLQELNYPYFDKLKELIK